MKKLYILISTLVFMQFGSAAFAHSALVQNNPAPNSHVSAGPQSVKLVFSTPLVFLDDSYEAELRVLDKNNKLVDPVCSTARIKSLESVYDFEAAGRYTVRWRAVEGEGHVMAGNYKFTVDESASNPNDTETLCKQAGLTVGQLKKSSSQKFESPGILELASEYWMIAASAFAIGGFLVWRRKNRSRT